MNQLGVTYYRNFFDGFLKVLTSSIAGFYSLYKLTTGSPDTASRVALIIAIFGQIHYFGMIIDDRKFYGCVRVKRECIIALTVQMLSLFVCGYTFLANLQNINQSPSQPTSPWIDQIALLLYLIHLGALYFELFVVGQRYWNQPSPPSQLPLQDWTPSREARLI